MEPDPCQGERKTSDLGIWRAESELMIADSTHSHVFMGIPVCDEYGNLNCLLRIKEQHNVSPVIACMSHISTIILNRIKKTMTLPAEERWGIHQTCYSCKTGSLSNQKPLFSVTSLLNSTGWKHSWWSRRQKRYLHKLLLNHIQNSENTIHQLLLKKHHLIFFF